MPAEAVFLLFFAPSASFARNFFISDKVCCYKQLKEPDALILNFIQLQEVCDDERSHGKHDEAGAEASGENAQTSGRIG